MTPEQAAAVDGALIGHSIDERYRLEGVIGVGGLGSVYRATHTKLQRLVAVKMLHETFGESQVQRGRFAREAKALAALQHPNIVAVLDYGVSAARPYLVMELLEGETLAQRLHRGPLDVQSALEITQQLLEALSFMHRAQLVHRDVKPSNVFLQATREGDERVKVLDLGLAKFTTPPQLMSGDPTLTRDGAIVGTPAYMSPEQATGEVVDARSDVYAVGVILYRMLAGRLPFEGDAIDQVRSHLIAPVPDLDRPEPDSQLDPALEKVIRRAMGKRREERFSDAGQMLRALAEAFPQYVGGTLPEHEVVLPDPFAVDAINAEWLLSGHDEDNDASSEVTTLPRVHRKRRFDIREGFRSIGRGFKSLVVTSVRLFAGVSVLLVITAGVVFVLLIRNDADRAELSALQRRLSDRFIERSMRGGAGAHAPKPDHDTAEAAAAAPGQLQRGGAADPPVAEPEAALAPAPELHPAPELEPAPEPVPALSPEPETTVQAATGLAPTPTPTAEPTPNPEAEPAPVPSSALAPSDPPAGSDPPPSTGTLPPPAPAEAQPAEPAPPVPPQPSAANPEPPPATEPRPVPAKPAAEPPALAAKSSDAEPQPSAATSDLPALAKPAGGAARDPWKDPIPQRLRLGRKVALNGGRGTENLILALREYNRDQRADPRGHLILGQLYLNRYWRADAMSQFSIALGLDPSVRGAPEALKSLLVLVLHGEFSLEAERLIASRYGSEALPAIERAMSEVKDPKVLARLRRLHARAATATR